MLLLQIIAKAIRDLLQIDAIPWNRSIRLPPREQLGKCIGYIMCVCFNFPVLCVLSVYIGLYSGQL